MREDVTDWDRATMESNQNAATDDYINARPQLDCIHNRRIFEAGFQRGWEAAIAALEI